MAVKRLSQQRPHTTLRCSYPPTLKSYCRSFDEWCIQTTIKEPSTMRNVIGTSIERFVSFTLFTLGLAAVTIAAAALLLIIGDMLGHA